MTGCAPGCRGRTGPPRPVLAIPRRARLSACWSTASSCGRPPDDEASYEADHEERGQRRGESLTREPDLSTRPCATFTVDDNIGCFTAPRRRLCEEGDYTEALAIMNEAADRIQPNSQDAALDLTEDLLKPA